MHQCRRSWSGRRNGGRRSGSDRWLVDVHVILDDELEIPDPTVGAREIRRFCDWCYVTSRECTTIPFSASMSSAAAVEDPK